MKFSPELEQHFQEHVRLGGDSRAMAIVLLGDENYARRVRMPKWNLPVSMLVCPQVAVRYNTSWGISTSKEGNRQRAEYFRELRSILKQAWNDLVEESAARFGKHGPLVSGVYRDHFPKAVKDRLRFLARAEVYALDAANLHDYLSKTHSPLFK